MAIRPIQTTAQSVRDASELWPDLGPKRNPKTSLERIVTPCDSLESHSSALGDTFVPGLETVVALNGLSCIYRKT